MLGTRGAPPTNEGQTLDFHQGIWMLGTRGAPPRMQYTYAATPTCQACCY
jgi:hypothetical protein